MNVYILAPQNRLSGGAELAHQLCHAINTLTDVKAFMVYVDVEASFDRALGADVNAPKPYEIYETYGKWYCFSCCKGYFYMIK